MNKPSKLITIAAGLTFYNSFVLFEEPVIDWLGYSSYLPCYNVGQFCEWDEGAIIIIVAGLSYWYHHKVKQQSSPSQNL